MNSYVLDTDILRLFQTGHDGVRRRVLEQPASELAITIISVEEQLSGWQAMLRNTKRTLDLVVVYSNMTRSVSALSRLNIVSFGESAIGRYLSLKAMKLNIGKMDLRIAAIVLDQDATLVTRNVRDFSRVPGLTMENWADSP